MTEEKVAGEGPNCRGCFAKQAQERMDAIEKGAEPKPLCPVAQRMQDMLTKDLEDLQGRHAPEQDNGGEPAVEIATHDGKMG